MTILRQGFGGYVSAGDCLSAEHEGFTIVATLHADDDQDPPWEREDGHGPVYTTKHPKAGWRRLTYEADPTYYYDYEGALALAMRDHWGPRGGDRPGLSREDNAKLAVEEDYEALRAWCEDEWRYYGVAVTVSKAGVQLTGEYDHAVWGIEGNYPGGDNSYFPEVANQLAEEALDAAKETLKTLCECEGVDHV
jgi:hypothetical protein